MKVGWADVHDSVQDTDPIGTKDESVKYTALRAMPRTQIETAEFVSHRQDTMSYHGRHSVHAANTQFQVSSFMFQVFDFWTT
jgi:hypothetical protein